MMKTGSGVYRATRQAWRDIWIGTEFDRELRSLEYPRAQEVLNTYLPYLDRSAPILEAGCGPGHVVYYLNELGYRSLGLDYAPEASQITHKRFPDLPLQLGDVHALPYPGNMFGAYLSFGVVEHFEHGPLPALQEAFRVLAANGVLVLTVPHPQFVDSLYELSKRLFPGRYARLAPRAAYYERTYSRTELADCVLQAGFHIFLVKPIAHSYTFYGLHRIFRNPGGYYETNQLGETAGAIARRLLPWHSAFHTMILARKSGNLKAVP